MGQPELGDLVVIRWRDSFNGSATTLAQLDSDCTWFTVGWVVKKTDLFLHLAASVQETDVGKGTDQIDPAIAVPWTQVLEWETL